MLAWAWLGDAVPIYPLYALLFADTGLDDAQISVLFALWSVVGIAAEVPGGALADRFARRTALVASSLVTALGFAVWTVWPTFAGFAVGFVLWGLAGSLESGAQQALLHDGLTHAGAADRYARVEGLLTAGRLAVQVPAAFLATGLLLVGGYALVGWVSVGLLVLAAAIGARIPEPPRPPDPTGQDGEPGFRDALRDGIREAVRRPPVRAAVLAAALLGGLDAIEAYFGLLAADWGWPVAAVPVALVVISLAGAAGAAGAGWVGRRAPVLLVAAFGLFGVAGVVAVPAGIAAVAVFFGLHRAVLVVADARLQERIEGRARATVTSVAGVAVEVVGLAVLGTWALGGLTLVVLVWLPVVAVASVLVRR